MKILKIKNWLACLCLGGMAFASNAGAITILNPNGVAPGTMFGTISPGLNSSVGNEVDFVNFLLNMTGATSTTGAPNAPGSGGGPQTYTTFVDLNGSVTAADHAKKETGNISSVSAGNGLVLGKYGGGNDQNQISVVWYLGGIAFTLPTTVEFNGVRSGGLSHHSTFGPFSTSVPDGGATVALLGVALGCMSLGRRFLKTA